MEDNTAERWKPVVGYEGYYEVSDLGRVRSLRHRWGPRPVPLVLKPQSRPSGHLHVSLYGYSKNGSTQAIHHLVLEAFVSPCPEGFEGCHGDGDPANNALGNLRWDTRSANVQDALRHGTQWQVAKTHCPKGHPYDEENTYIRAGGRRGCKACSRENAKVQTEKATAARTHCPNGHEYTPENTKFLPQGIRRCITCDELGLRKPRLKVCQRGHEMAGGNIYVTPDGRRQCRACRSLRGKKAA
jgi:NUMOD4 motif/HNH endonuclease